MAKTVKKVDYKKVAKLQVSKELKEFFESKGVSVSDGVGFGFTQGTLVLHTEKCDVQVKLITGKSGVDRYTELEEEVEETSTESEGENEGEGE